MKALAHRWERHGPPDRQQDKTVWEWWCRRCDRLTTTQRARRPPWKHDPMPAPRPAGGDCGAELVRLVDEL